MKRLLYILLFLTATSAIAQSKKDKALLRLAKNEYNHFRYSYAIPVFKSYLQKKSNDTIALKMLSDCYQKLNAYDSALFYKEKAVLLGATKTKQLAELYANNNDYAKAKDLYAYFLSEEITKTAEARLYGFKNTAGMLADSLDYRLHNLSINTPFNEFNGVLYKDGLVLESNRIKMPLKPKKFIKRFFTRTPKPHEFAWDGAGFSKLYYYPNIDSIRIDSAFVYRPWMEKTSKLNYTDYSVITPNDSRKVPSTSSFYFTNYEDKKLQNFDAFLSDQMNVGAVSFTTDGKKAYYTRNQKKSNNIYQLEIWEAFQIEGQWVGAHKLFFNNSKYSYFHPAITPDGKRLYYVSDDPAGQGGTDIYYVDQNEDGSWRNTVNLGQDINTTSNELFPTFYEGNLYISSNGHPGLGGLDIYKLTRNNKGSVVLKNMGYPINSNKDDFALSIKGEKGFFSSNRYGSDDIIAFDHIVSFIKMRGKVLLDSNCVAGKKVYLQQINEKGVLVTKDSTIIGKDCTYEFNVRPNQTYTIMAYNNDGKNFEQVIQSDGYVKMNDNYIKEATLINIPLPEKEKLEAKMYKEFQIDYRFLESYFEGLCRITPSIRSGIYN
jgi:hypothetical protein